MNYFSPAFITFFTELSENNRTDWFQANRKTYEKEVKTPFSALVNEMIRRIRYYEPEIQIQPAEAIVRINKDIRFSMDKSPYQTHVAANISVYGKKDKTYPGFYIQLSHNNLQIFGGAHMIEPGVLQKIRSYIAKYPDDFSAAYNDTLFKEKYGSIQGEQHKRIPEEFQILAATEPLIANKQFYYRAELKPEILLSDTLPEILMDYYVAGKKFNDFLKRALSE